MVSTISALEIPKYNRRVTKCGVALNGKDEEEEGKSLLWSNINTL
jgi:hypothetical protein